jgi:hypothetical protein
MKIFCGIGKNSTIPFLHCTIPNKQAVIVGINQIKI